MAVGLEKIKFKDVKKIVEDSLMLDEPVEIYPETKLSALGADLMDFADIAFKVGINYTKYVQGEKLTNNAREKYIPMIANEYRTISPEKTRHFIELGRAKNIYDLVGLLTVGDFLDIRNYELKMAGCGC